MSKLEKITYSDGRVEYKRTAFGDELMGDLAANAGLAGKILKSTTVLTGDGIQELKEKIGTMKKSDVERDLVEELVKAGDLVILVTPIDEAAPKGRLILPQQMTIRALLDHGCMTMVVRDTELADALEKLKKRPDLVITDSQAFGKVSKIVPREIPLTSFSILMARYKGDLEQVIEGVSMLDRLEDGAEVKNCILMQDTVVEDGASVECLITDL